MHLEMICDRCAVAKSCSKFGSSPLIYLKKRYVCLIIGGYGKTPVDESILSETSLKLSKRSGPCLTLAYIPEVQEETVNTVLTKIFSPPIISDHEKTNIPLDSVYSRSHK